MQICKCKCVWNSHGEGRWPRIYFWKSNELINFENCIHHPRCDVTREMQAENLACEKYESTEDDVFAKKHVFLTGRT